MTVIDRGDKDVDVILRYASGSKKITLIEAYTPREAGSGVAFDTDDTGQKTVTINGNPGTLLFHKNGTARLTWTDKWVTYNLTGALAEEELVRIAGSLATDNRGQ